MHFRIESRIIFLITALLFLMAETHAQSLNKQCQPVKSYFSFYLCEMWSAQCNQRFSFYNCSKQYCSQQTVSREKNADGTVTETQYCSQYSRHYYDESTCLKICCGEIPPNVTSFAGGMIQQCKDNNTQQFINFLKFIGMIIGAGFGFFIILGIIAFIIEMVKKCKRSQQQRLHSSHIERVSYANQNSTEVFDNSPECNDIENAKK